MVKSYEDFLNPDNFKIDQREILDSIILIKEYSKRINFYDKNNKIDQTWHEMLKSDESFLIAEISNFPINSFNTNRLQLIQRYDEGFSLLEKTVIFNEFFNSTLSLFESINKWYVEALTNNLSQESSKIELELEAAIQNKLSPLLCEFITLSLEFIKSGLIENSAKLSLNNFSTIWKLSISPIGESEEASINENELNFAFKKIILIFNPTFEILFNIVSKSKKLFFKSLYENDNHKAHIGLLFSFLELIKHVRADLNTITKKHLDLYYKEILKLSYLPSTPKSIFVTMEIDENVDSINLAEKAKIKVGQKDDGEDIIFLTDEEIQLNNTKLSHISTFFLSENNVFQYDSRFNLISGLYSKTFASSIEEVERFNNDNSNFSSLGEEQSFYIADDMNMKKSDIGFILASPAFVLSKSDRKIDIDFKFTMESITFLSDLILDISQNRNIHDEVMFDEIFANAFTIQYTSEEKWVDIADYKVIAPLDWTSGSIRISFKLNKAYPDFVPYDHDVHQLHIDTLQPLLKFTINQDSFYNPYSFLNGMKLLSININVKVENLKKLNCFINTENVDSNSEFEIFGPTPKLGSNMVIGTDEIFNKKITQLSVAWQYSNLAVLEGSLKEYYQEYDMDIDNDSFKMKVSALSNFNYSENSDSNLVFDVFDKTLDGEIDENRIVANIDVEALDIRPNFNLKFDALENYSNDLETGFLKFELISPKFGFGFDIFDKVYTRNSQKSISSQLKKGVPEIVKPPNDPFSPLIQNLSLSYESKSTLNFDQVTFYENDKTEPNALYLTSPYGIENIFTSKLALSDTLVKSFKYEGELVLGFEGFTPHSKLNLLFEILKSENQNYEVSREIDWYYSSAEGWKLFQSEDILYDQTMNLMKTGVLCFKCPTDLSDKQTVFNEAKMFIKACSKSKSNRFSLIRSIRTNSVSASEIIDETSEQETKDIMPYAAEGFLEPIEGVIGLTQYLASFKGKNRESDLDFYRRSSELLRHKNRPVTKWDFEKFILGKFDWLSHVKCFTINNADYHFNMKILCIKKIEKQQNFDNIKLSAAEKSEIKGFLRKYTSPFSNVEIINPVFEDLWIKCKVSFKNISNGKGIQKLNTDFFNFACSWIYEPKLKHRIGEKIKKLDIINFLSSRDYVSYITGISIIHIKKLEDGSQVVLDSAADTVNNDFLQPGFAWSLIIPKHSHKIDILEKNDYYAPTPINFDELEIDQSFLITSSAPDNSTSVVIGKGEKKGSADTKFNFKIKL
jgi:hypothetical protein